MARSSQAQHEGDADSTDANELSDAELEGVSAGANSGGEDSAGLWQINSSSERHPQVGIIKRLTTRLLGR